MKVAISMRVVQASGYIEPRDAISHDWMHWLEAIGCAPLLVPNALQDPAAYLSAHTVDGLILTGGNDAVCGPASADFSAERNACETQLLRFAIEKEMPILAVCRGLHMVNLLFGGDVEADIGDSHVANDHAITITNSLGGALVVGDGLKTNSFHHQGVTPNGVGEALLPVAVSVDGYVEALVHQTLPVLALQWHPERKNPGAAVDQMLITRLFSEGAFWNAE